MINPGLDTYQAKTPTLSYSPALISVLILQKEKAYMLVARDQYLLNIYYVTPIGWMLQIHLLM